MLIANGAYCPVVYQAAMRYTNFRIMLHFHRLYSQLIAEIRTNHIHCQWDYHTEFRLGRNVLQLYEG